MFFDPPLRLPLIDFCALFCLFPTLRRLCIVKQLGLGMGMGNGNGKSKYPYPQSQAQEMTV